MRSEYDFSGAVKNPHKTGAQQITIHMDAATADFFRSQAKRSGIPWQTLINLYLSDCAANKRQLEISWK